MEAVVGASGFAAYLLLAAIVMRVATDQSPAFVVVALALLGYLATLAAALVLLPRVAFWPLSAVYWFFSISVLMIFGAVYKSISLRMLGELYERPDQSEAYDDLVKRYIEQESYTGRLKVLLDGNFAVESNGLYSLTGKGCRLAVGVDAIQRVFGIRRSG